MDKFISYVLHAVAGILVVAGPSLLAATPASIQSMTLGAIILIAFKWAHDFLGY